MRALCVHACSMRLLCVYRRVAYSSCVSTVCGCSCAAVMSNASFVECIPFDSRVPQLCVGFASPRSASAGTRLGWQHAIHLCDARDLPALRTIIVAEYDTRLHASGQNAKQSKREYFLLIASPCILFTCIIHTQCPLHACVL